MKNSELQFVRFLDRYTTFRWLIVLVVAFLVSLAIFKIIDIYIPRLIKNISFRAYNAIKKDELIKWRRRETFMHVFIAAFKVVVMLVTIYISWRLINPNDAPIALITASAVAVVLTSSILGPLLRDIAYGGAMIAERWYNVGDYIHVEPFSDVKGIVEGVTLRSTTLRGLNGEIIKVHNQNIQGVRMTPMGVRMLAFEVFVNDPDKGKKIVNAVLKTVPKSATMVEDPFKVRSTEKLATNLWKISAYGSTVAGREWLIEDYATEALKQADEKDTNTIVHGPIVRFADPAAEKRFKRSVRSREN